MATITKLPSGRYHVRVRKTGHASVSATHDLKSQAMAWARQTEASMDRGDYRSTRDIKFLTLGELLDRYRLEVAPERRCAAHWDRHLRFLATQGLAAVRVLQLTGAHVARWRDERLKAGTSPETVRRNLGVLSSVFNHARREWNLAVDNPFARVRLPSPTPHRDRVVTPDEERRLLETKDSELAFTIAVLVDTGLRSGELARLRWEQVDLNRRTFAVVSYKGTGKPTTRRVPLTQRVVRLLEERRRKTGKVLKVESANTVGKKFGRWSRSLGMDDLRLHDLRHTCLTRLAEKGWNAAELMAVSGHSSLAMLGRYLHVSSEHLVEKLDR